MALSEPERARLTQAGLNLIQQAISIYDADLKLAVCNRPFRDMFHLPDAFVTPGADFGDTIRFLVERGEYGDVEDVDQVVVQTKRTAKVLNDRRGERHVGLPFLEVVHETQVSNKAYGAATGQNAEGASEVRW